MKRLKKTILYMTLPLFLFLFLSVFIPFLNFAFSKDDLSASAKSRVKIIGHRGAAGIAPENTLTSFQKAMDIGAYMVELDVHLSLDDSIIVMHDYEVKRTTNGKGKIEDFFHLLIFCYRIE